MNTLQRKLLIDTLAIDIQDCYDSPSVEDFIDGFSFKGFKHMTDEELISEATEQYEGQEWFEVILLSHTLDIAIKE